MRHSLFSDIQTLTQQTFLPTLSAPVASAKVGKETAFLTGATGFIGGYLLVALIQSKKYAQYICLVRGESEKDARLRLQQNLEKKGLSREAFENAQITIVLGDILQPGFGLSAADKVLVIHDTDHVFHFAATMNWVTPFNQNTLDNLSALREVLIICASVKPKLLHYASSMGLWTVLKHDREVILETDQHPHGDQLAGGYFQSKWVAEQMLHAAMAKGLQVNIYRIGDVKGSAKDGMGDAANFGNLVMHYFIHTGKVIDKSIPEFNFIPVDYLAACIAVICQKETNKTFQFSNQELISFTDIGQSMEQAGFQTSYLPMTQWLEVLHQDKTMLGRTLNAIFRKFKPGGQWPATSFYEIGVDMFTKKHDTQNTTAATAPAGISAPLMKSDGTLGKYLNHLSTLRL